MTPKLILASASPRRRELLAQAGYNSTSRYPPCPRRAARKRTPSASPPGSPGRRPKKFLPGISRRIVLGADTVVVCDGEVMGKPADPADAERMLLLLAGRTHQVVTGVAVVWGSSPSPAIEVAAELTQVTMRTLWPEEVSRYVATGEPMDKAGAYAIQGYAARWIPRISGCYFNVVGLPLALVATMLEAAESRLDTGIRPIQPLRLTGLRSCSGFSPYVSD